MSTLPKLELSDSSDSRAKARAEIVEWDEYGQGYSTAGELVVCICGAPYPLRWTHYCPYDEPTEDEGSEMLVREDGA
jgi:hypothetical protein